MNELYVYKDNEKASYRSVFQALCLPLFEILGLFECHSAHRKWILGAKPRDSGSLLKFTFHLGCLTFVYVCVCAMDDLGHLKEPTDLFSE